MAITFSDKFGPNASKATGTTLTVNLSAIVVGTLVVVVFASDDAAGTFSIADTQGNTWVECKNQLNSGNVRTIVWASLLTTAIISGSFTVTHPSLDARAAGCASFAGVASATPDQTNAANATAASGVFASGSITPSENNELLIGGLGWEGVGADAPGSIAGFTTANVGVATSGGGAASNIGELLYYQIQTTLAADNFDGSMATGRDNAACVVSFKATPSSSPSFVPPPSNTFWNAMQARSAA
jgi:hypothetical protein